METPVQLGKYVITGTLGRGAMGVVYKGFDPNILRPVALKTIRRDFVLDTESGTLAARFRNEAQAAGRLGHPGIVAVYDYGEDGEIAYIAMEYVEGHDLADYFKRGVRFSPGDAVSVMAQLLDALDHAHGHGVVHRDIKPANIIITTGGRVKVADFGIARMDFSDLTQLGMVMGTPSYMAPEQYLGLPVDARVDLFAAGVVLFQMLTGEKPFQGTYEQVAYRVCHDPIPRARAVAPDCVTPAMDDTLQLALARDPEARFQSARAFREALLAAYAAPVAGTLSEDTRIIEPPGQAVRAGTVPPRTPPPAGSAPSSRSLPPPGWDAATLKVVEGQLAQFVGPLAKILVRKAASGTSDLDALYASVAEELDADDRAAFLARQAKGATHAAGSTGRPSSLPVAGPGQAAGGAINAETIDQAAHDLARYLGPIGKVVARRVAPRAASRQQYYLLLAAELEPADRAAFLQSAGVTG